MPRPHKWPRAGSWGDTLNLAPSRPGPRRRSSPNGTLRPTFRRDLAPCSGGRYRQISTACAVLKRADHSIWNLDLQKARNPCTEDLAGSSKSIPRTCALAPHRPCTNWTPSTPSIPSHRCSRCTVWPRRFRTGMAWSSCRCLLDWFEKDSPKSSVITNRCSPRDSKATLIYCSIYHTPHWARK